MTQNLSYAAATPKNTKIKAMHPAVMAAQQFREDLQTDTQPPVVPQQPAQPQITPAVQQPVQQPVQQTSPPVVEYTPVTNIPLPAGYTDFLSFSPPPSTPPQSPTPVVNTFEEDNKKLLAELEETRKKLEEAQSRAQVPEELRALQEERLLENMLSQANLEFSSINTDDAKKLLAPIVSTVRKQTADLEEAFKKRLEAQQLQLDSTVNTLNETQKQARVEATRKKILDAHPDLENFQKSEAYHKVMLSPVSGKSDLLVGQLVSAEFQRGNADYIIDLINSIKGAQPNLESIASVSANGIGTTVATSGANDSDGLLSDEDLANLKFDMQRGVVSREDYSTAMKKHREAASKDFSHKSK